MIILLTLQIGCAANRLFKPAGDIERSGGFGNSRAAPQDYGSAANVLCDRPRQFLTELLQEFSGKGLTFHRELGLPLAHSNSLTASSFAPHRNTIATECIWAGGNSWAL